MMRASMRGLALLALGLGAVLHGGCGDDAEVRPVAGTATEPAMGSWLTLDGWAEAQGGNSDPKTGLPTRIRRLVDGAPMVLVPGGTFLMGAQPDDEESWRDEKPRVRVEVSPFYMDAHEVTHAQFRAFVLATGYETEAIEVGKGYGLSPPGSTERMAMISGLTWKDCNPCRGGDHDTHPVSCVTWRDAVAYCAWAGATLPMEEEFEYALQLDVGAAKYPWGAQDTLPVGFANVCGPEVGRAYPQAKSCPYLKGAKDGFVGTAPVMSFSPNSLGIYDLCGNVSEWCAGLLWVPYKTGIRSLTHDDDDGVVRGGNWASSRQWLRTCIRGPAHRSIVRAYIGFRCVWRPEERSGP